MKEQSVITLSFRKSPGGFQVLCTFRDKDAFQNGGYTSTGVIRDGREMTEAGALRYAQRYAACNKAPRVSFVIDERGLDADNLHPAADMLNKEK